MAEDDDGKEYRWESGYEKTWEAIEEDVDGLVETSVASIVQKAKRKRLEDRQSGVRLGMMRHLFLIIDLSDCMTQQDLRPTRQRCIMKLLEAFVEEFFDQNPISQIGIIIMRNKRAERMAELSGNPRKHIEVLRELSAAKCSGEPSLQNSLQMALQTLRHLPSHASLEILIIFGNLTTCDPGDINTVIKELKSCDIRCSVIGLAAEVRIARHLTVETDGHYGVVLDESHLQELLNREVDPPTAAASCESTLIKMGFPYQGRKNEEVEETVLAICMCHLETPEGSRLKEGGFSCPQCRSRYCELPVECRTCGLTLVSAPHLARCVQHLFPLPPFMEENIVVPSDSLSCYACQKELPDVQGCVYRCDKCSKIFCLDCDLFIHETLRVCPGCASLPDIPSL